MKLFIEDSTNNIMVGQDTDTAPTGWTEKTTLIDVGWNYDSSPYIEFKKLRAWVNTLFLAKGEGNPTVSWLACSADEKKAVCKFMLMPYANRLTVHTEQEDKDYWDDMVIRTEGQPFGMLTGRAKTYELMRICVSEYVRMEAWVTGDFIANITQAQAFFRDCYNMKEFYIAADDPEFKDFIFSSGQYDATTGFKSKSYYLAELETELQNIYNQ